MFKFFMNAVFGVVSFVTSPIWYPLYLLSVVGKTASETVSQVSRG